jgi:hypothetical protein
MICPMASTFAARRRPVYKGVVNLPLQLMRVFSLAFAPGLRSENRPVSHLFYYIFGGTADILNRRLEPDPDIRRPPQLVGQGIGQDHTGFASPSTIWRTV